jgi:hypothetical protein
MSDNVFVRADSGRPKAGLLQKDHDTRLQSGRRDLETVQPHASVVMRVKVSTPITLRGYKLTFDHREAYGCM